MNSNKFILAVGKDILKTTARHFKNCEKSLGKDFIQAVKLLKDTEGKIVFTGMGKSGIIAKKLTATLASTGEISIFLHPSEAFHGDLGIVKNNDTIICLSHSGETTEILALVEMIKITCPGVKIIAISSHKKTRLAKLSDVTVATRVKTESKNPETWMIPTTSSSISLALGDALIIALTELNQFKAKDFLKNHPGGEIGNQLRKSNSFLNKDPQKVQQH